MDNKYKDADALKVIDKKSHHYGKIGVVTDFFQLRTEGKPIFYVMLFPDNSTGSIQEDWLEKFNGKLLKPIVPPINTGGVWVTEEDGLTQVYTLGQVIYGSPPDNVKDRGSIIRVPIVK